MFVLDVEGLRNVLFATAEEIRALREIEAEEAARFDAAGFPLQLFGFMVLEVDEAIAPRPGTIPPLAIGIEDFREAKRRELQLAELREFLWRRVEEKA